MHRLGTLDLNSIMELVPAEHSVLGALFHKHAGQPFSAMMTPAQSAEEGLSGAEAKAAFIRLGQKGWIKAVRKTWGERLYYIPVNRIPVLTLAYAHRVGNPMKQGRRNTERDECSTKTIWSDHVEVVREVKADIAAELLHVLAWIAREGLPLTNKGTVHKRAIQRLSGMTMLCAEDFVGLNIRYEHPDVYPVHFAILLDMLFSLGLVEKGQGRIQVSHDRLRSWLTLPWSSMHREIFTMCMERYSASEPASQHFRYRLMLLSPRPNEWFGIPTMIPESGRLEEADKSTGNVHASESSLPEYVQGWLYALAGWGYGEIGKDAAGDLFFRWEVDPYALLYIEGQEDMDMGKNGFFVQPDFEIMVPPEVTPQVRWSLENCAELVSRDRMSIYRMTKEGITDAARNGFTSDKVVRFLEHYAVTGVPEHVHLAVQQWGYELERLQMDSDPKMENDDMGEFQVSVRTSLPREPFYVQDRQGIVHNGPDLHVYEQDQSVTEELNLLPGYGEIPEMWHNDWRRYHMSTARQIAAKAIEWQTKLGLKMKDDVVYVIPDQIQGHDDWTLTGWFVPGPYGKHTERCTITPNEWDKMRIIVPEQI